MRGRGERLDQAAVGRGLFPSREKARAAILAGEVFIDDRVASKPGLRVMAETLIEHRPKRGGHDYVGRGALKLKAALDAFGMPVAGRVCLDAGASTGGFTEVLLRAGAAKVYAVDVGYGQLAWSLRQDARVVVKERVNARHLTRDQVPDPLGVATLDLSFISLRLVLPAILDLVEPGGDLIPLIKPQFEAGKGEVPRGGVIRDAELRARILDGFREFCEARPDLEWRGVIESPITGANGNIEYLAWLKKPPAPVSVEDSDGAAA